MSEPSEDPVVRFAHELNKLLAVIAGFAASAGSRLASDDGLDIASLKRAVDEIAAASGRATELTRELLAETRPASRK